MDPRPGSDAQATTMAVEPPTDFQRCGRAADGFPVGPDRVGQPGSSPGSITPSNMSGAGAHHDRVDVGEREVMSTSSQRTQRRLAHEARHRHDRCRLSRRTSSDRSRRPRSAPPSTRPPTRQTRFCCRHDALGGVSQGPVPFSPGEHAVCRVTECDSAPLDISECASTGCPTRRIDAARRSRETEGLTEDQLLVGVGRIESLRNRPGRRERRPSRRPRARAEGARREVAN